MRWIGIVWRKKKYNLRLSCELLCYLNLSTRSLVPLLNFHFYSNANLSTNLRDCEWIQRNLLAPCLQLIIRELWSVWKLVDFNYNFQRIKVDNWQQFFLSLFKSDMLHFSWTIAMLSQIKCGGNVKKKSSGGKCKTTD